MDIQAKVQPASFRSTAFAKRLKHVAFNNQDVAEKAIGIPRKIFFIYWLMAGIDTRANNNHKGSSERVPSIIMCLWRSYAFQFIRPLIKLSHLQDKIFYTDILRRKKFDTVSTRFNFYDRCLLRILWVPIANTQFKRARNRPVLVIYIHTKISVHVLGSGPYPWDLFSKRLK